MSALAFVQFGLAVAALFWTLYLLLVPLAARFRPPARRQASPGTGTSVAVIIPAHNMEKFIARCIAALRACRLPRGESRIYVIADHCTDDTAARARASGVTVLERTAEPAGKTYAIAWGLEQLNFGRATFRWTARF